MNDILVCILDKVTEMEMKKALKDVDIVLDQVATKWNLLLEREKHEEIVFYLA